LYRSGRLGRARDALVTGQAAALDFTLNEDIAVDYGLACGGTERILVDPTFTSGDLHLVRNMLARAEGALRGVVITATVSPGDKLALWEDGTVNGDLGPDQKAALELARRLMEAPRPRPALVRFPSMIQL
jgi:xanthine/CO dehydrogenase XdhC/CoxF family maturation factor